MGVWRSRWAAVGAAAAVSLGAGGVSLVDAGLDTGERPVTVTVSPERVLDTRVDLGLTGPFVSQTPRDVQITGEVPVASGGSKAVVPAGAVAVLVNVTVVGPPGPGFLSLRPGGAAGDPSTSTVNFLAAGSVEPNSATVDLAADGSMQVYLFTAAPAGVADVLVDVVGYTIDHTHDDRYYTEAEVDALIASITPGSTGASYAHVIVVAESGGDYTSVVDAMAAIGTDPKYPAASATERYLVWVAPGTYEGQVIMQPYVDIEGSGQGVTTIRAVAGAAGISPDAATVVGASNAELRKLRVEVSPPNPSQWSHAIYTNQATTFREVTASSTGGARSRGMVVATGGTPVLIDVILSATGASDSNLGLDLFNATAFGDGVFATASGGDFAKAVLLNNASSEVKLENITTAASDGALQTYGLEVAGSNATIEGYRTTVTASGGNVLGARCSGVDRFMKILDGTIFASNSGGQTRGVFGASCNLELRDMVVDAISESTSPAQGIDHFQNDTTTPASVVISDVGIRAESTGGSSIGIQLNGNASGAGTFGEVRDVTIRSTSASAGLNYGIRHAAQGEMHYRTLSITVRGETEWAWGILTSGGTHRINDVVIDSVLSAESTVFGVEIFTSNTILTNVRASAINLGTGDGHDAVGLKANTALDVIFRDVSAYAEAETNAWGIDVTGSTARLIRVDATARANSSHFAFGVRCISGAVDVVDSNLEAHSENAYGLFASNCTGGLVDDSTLLGNGPNSFGALLTNPVSPGAFTMRDGSSTGKTASVRSTDLGDLTVMSTTLSGGAGSVSGASTQTCIGVVYDSGGAAAFDAGPTSPCP